MSSTNDLVPWGEWIETAFAGVFKLMKGFGCANLSRHFRAARALADTFQSPDRLHVGVLGPCKQGTSITNCGCRVSLRKSCLNYYHHPQFWMLFGWFCIYEKNTSSACTGLLCCSKQQWRASFRSCMCLGTRARSMWFSGDGSLLRQGRQQARGAEVWEEWESCGCKVQEP